MLRILSVLLTCLCFQSFSQTDPVGHFIDQDGKTLVSGYFTTDFVPGNLLTAQINPVQDFQYGTIHHLDGTEEDGWIKFVEDIQVILFTKLIGESGEADSTEVRLTPSSISGFAIGEDRFHSTTKFKSGGLLNLKVNEAFLPVVYENDSLALLKFGGEVTTPSYYLLRGDSVTYISTNEKKFKKLLLPLVRSSRMLSSKVASELYGPDHVENIILVLDEHIRLETGQKAYYNQFWERIEDSTEAEFYHQVVNRNDTIWQRDYFAMNGTRFLTGHYSSFTPPMKHGTFTWFYPNGERRKKINYEKNRVRGPIQEYFPNGQLHRVYNRNGKIKAIFNENGEKSDGKKEVFPDPYQEREITRFYKNGRVIQSYYLSEAGQAIYQYAEKNSQFRNAARKLFQEYLYFPQEGKKANAEGLMILRLIVGATGAVESWDLLQSVHPAIDEMVSDYMENSLIGKNSFKPATSGKTKVSQEVLIGIAFRVRRPSRRWSNLWFDHNWMEFHDRGINFESFEKAMSTPFWEKN